MSEYWISTWVERNLWTIYESHFPRELLVCGGHPSYPRQPYSPVTKVREKGLLLFVTNEKRMPQKAWRLAPTADVTAGPVSDSVCVYLCMLVMPSCLTLCNCMDCSLSDSTVRGILQARTLEWVSMPFSRDLPDHGAELCLLRLLHWQTVFTPKLPGEPTCL